MLSKQTIKSRIDTQQQILENINEYFIKIDYFDQKGTKDFENNIPLRIIFNNNKNLSENNLNLEY
tara:strand:- start:22 stop:216 length:195 start_codon:yes stop_codon:yes gene_type:complete